MASNGYITMERRPAGLVGVNAGHDHCYLVHRANDGKEFVIRGGPGDAWRLFGADMDIEVNKPIARSKDRRSDETSEDRGSTRLEFGMSTDEAWAIMVKYARMIDKSGLDYNVLTCNSNTFIAAVVAATGVDPDDMRPRGVSRDEALGYANFGTILKAVKPPADGTVDGTEGADVITGIQVGQCIRALGGNDIVRAGDGDDRVEGGEGDDLLLGQAGADILIGGNGRDTLYADDPDRPSAPGSLLPGEVGRLYGDGGRDRLFGSADRDVMVGGTGSDLLRAGDGDDRMLGGRGRDLLDGGAGTNTLYGGGDADTFCFSDDSASLNRVRDFGNGDDLLRIDADGVTRLADLAIRPAGPDGQHTRVAFAETVVVLYGLTFEEFGRGDVVFGPLDALLA